MKQFRVAFFVHGEVVTVSELVDLVDGLAAERGWIAKGYPARLMTESRALRRLHDEFACTCTGATSTVTVLDNKPATSQTVQIVDEEGPVAEIEPRDLAGPTADDVARHTPAPRKDGEL